MPFLFISYGGAAPEERVLCSHTEKVLKDLKAEKRFRKVGTLLAAFHVPGSGCRMLTPSLLQGPQ